MKRICYLFVLLYSCSTAQKPTTFYSKAEIDAMLTSYQLKANLSTDARKSIVGNGDINYNQLTGIINYSTPKNLSQYINDIGYLSKEIDPVYSSSVAKGITSQNIQSWNNSKPLSITFSGTNTKTLFINFADGSNISGSFTDMQGAGSGTVNISDIPGLQSQLDILASKKQLSDSVSYLNLKINTYKKTLDSIIKVVDSITKDIYIFDTTFIQVPKPLGSLDNINGIGVTTSFLTQARINEFNGNLKWARIRPGWNSFGYKEPYIYTQFDQTVDLCVKNGLKLMWQIISSPYDNVPVDLWKPPYNVPIIFTDDPRPDLSKFPHSVNTTFNVIEDNFFEDISNHINAFPKAYQDVLVYWNSMPGVTGDYTLKKGNIIKVTINGVNQTNINQYNTTDQEVTDYFHTKLLRLISINKQNNFIKIGANPDNTERDLEYDFANGVSAFKRGELAHTIWNNGEGLQIRKTLDLRSKKQDIFFFAESEGTSDNPLIWTNQEDIAMLSQAIAAGINSISFQHGSKTRDTAFQIFNRHAAYPKSGYCYFKYVVDFADTIRFNKLIYGEPIDPLKLTSYNRIVQNIKNSNITESEKEEQLSTVFIKNFNPERKQRIIPQFLTQGYKFDGDSIFHRMDGGIDLYNNGLNYEWRLHMANFKGTGVMRIGDSSWVFGRACLLINDADFKYDGNSITELSITYYDEASSFDVFFYIRGSEVLRYT